MAPRAAGKPERKNRDVKGTAWSRVPFYLLCGLLPLAIAVTVPAGIRWRPEVVVGGLILIRYLYLVWVLAGARRVIRLRRRIAGSPTEPSNYFHLAALLYQRGFAGEAVGVFRQGMRLDPGMLVETPEGAVKVLCRFGNTQRERRIIQTLCGLALMEHVVEEAGAFPMPLSEIMALGSDGSAERSVVEEVEELVERLKSQREGVELLAQCVPPEDHRAYLSLDAELRQLDRRIRELDEIRKQLS